MWPSSDQISNLVFAFVLTAVGSVFGFIVSRHFRAKDKSEEKLETIKECEVKRIESMLGKLDVKLDQMIARQESMREDVGRIRMTHEAIWRKLDELVTDTRDLRARQDRLQERL